LAGRRGDVAPVGGVVERAVAQGELERRIGPVGRGRDPQVKGGPVGQGGIFSESRGWNSQSAQSMDSLVREYSALKAVRQRREENAYREQVGRLFAHGKDAANCDMPLRPSCALRRGVSEP